MLKTHLLGSRSKSHCIKRSTLSLRHQSGLPTFLFLFEAWCTGNQIIETSALDYREILVGARLHAKRITTAQIHDGPVFRCLNGG